MRCDGGVSVAATSLRRHEIYCLLPHDDVHQVTFNDGYPDGDPSGVSAFFQPASSSTDETRLPSSSTSSTEDDENDGWAGEQEEGETCAGGGALVVFSAPAELQKAALYTLKVRQKSGSPPQSRHAIVYPPLAPVISEPQCDVAGAAADRRPPADRLAESYGCRLSPLRSSYLSLHTNRAHPSEQPDIKSPAVFLRNAPSLPQVTCSDAVSSSDPGQQQVKQKQPPPRASFQLNATTKAVIFSSACTGSVTIYVAGARGQPPPRARAAVAAMRKRLLLLATVFAIQV